jgi:hypothetical protein
MPSVPSTAHDGADSAPDDPDVPAPQAKPAPRPHATSAAPSVRDAKTLAAAAKAAFEAAAARKSYPKIEASFRLGWHMAELLLIARSLPDPDKPAADEKAAPPTRLESPGDLDPSIRLELLVRQITVDAKEIGQAAGIAPAQLPVKLDGLEQLKPDDRAAAIATTHRALVTGLTASDFRLGKAYHVGIALADTTLQPDANTFASERVRTMCGNVDDLKETFALYASHAVSETLRVWAQWGAKHPGVPHGDAAVALGNQGRIWRALLSGEKAPTELLGTEDYVMALENAGRRGVHTARQIAHHMRIAIVTAVALFAAVAAALVYFTHGDARGLVGVAAILGALGISWKGMGAVLGRSFERVESEVWDAELGDRVAAKALSLPR